MPPFHIWFPFGVVLLLTAGNMPLEGGEAIARQHTAEFPMFRLRGRIDTDFLWTNQTAENRAVFGDVQEVVGLRRVRIGAEGYFSPDHRYVSEIDLASGAVVVRDYYIGWGKFVETGEFRLGHMREPFSLEGGTSANTFPFLERSPINTLDPARNWGIAYSYCGGDERWTIAGGLFASGTDANDFDYRPGSTTDLTFKWTGLAAYEDQGARLIHYGLAVSERISNQGEYVINQKPRSSLISFEDSSQAEYTPKIQLAAGFQQLFNLQWAAVHGPMWVQAEWYGTIIDQSDGAAIFYHGNHLDVGYFLTGEHRQYLTHSGIFGPISVRRPVLSQFSSKPHAEELGLGAWELTGRLAYLDFIDQNNPTDSTGNLVGVQLTQATLGVNWYLADRMRLMFNYVYFEPQASSTGVSSANQFGMRLGMFW